MGGNLPLGFAVQDRKLVIIQSEAGIVRQIFNRFLEIASATELARELDAQGVTNQRGNRIDKKLSTPLSCSTSSTFRSERGNRTCSVTARRMISGEVLKYRDGLNFYPQKIPDRPTRLKPV